MKIYTKTPYKRLLTLSFMTLLSYDMKADSINNAVSVIQGTDDTQTLTTLNTAVAALPGDITTSQGVVTSAITSAVSTVQGTDTAQTLTTVHSAVTTLGSVSLATHTDATTIEGASFVAETDDLHHINTNVKTLQGTGFVSGTDDLHTLSGVLAAIEGASFTSAHSLVNLATSTNVSDVQTALATDITNATNSSSYIGNAVDTMAASTTLAAVQTAVVGASGSNTLLSIATTLGTPTSSIAADIHTLGTTALATSADLTTLANFIFSGDSEDVSGISHAFASLGGEGDVSGISTALGTIEGASFDTGTDSLHNISNNTITVPFATSAQVGALANTGGTATIAGILGDAGASTGAASISDAIGAPLVATTASTLALVLGDPHAATPSASASISAALGAIEGASFTSAHSLVNLATSTNVSDVQTALATDITNATNSSSYIGNAVDTMAASTTLAAVKTAIVGTSGSNTLLSIATTLGTPTSSIAADIHTLGTTALATSADLTTLANFIFSGDSEDVSGISYAFASLGGEGDVSGISAAFAALTVITQNLSIIAQIGAVNVSAANAALTVALVVVADTDDHAGTYSINLGTALGLISTAVSSPSRANTTAAKNSLHTATDDFNLVLTDNPTVNSLYSLAEINNALLQLAAQLAYLETLQS